MDKQKQREEIAKLTQEYLDRGGVIEVIPPRRFVPACYPWMSKYDIDYQPWNYVGGVGGGSSINEVQHLDEGCSMKDACFFEGQGDG